MLAADKLTRENKHNTLWIRAVIAFLPFKLQIVTHIRDSFSHITQIQYHKHLIRTIVENN